MGERVIKVAVNTGPSDIKGLYEVFLTLVKEKDVPLSIA